MNGRNAITNEEQLKEPWTTQTEETGQGENVELQEQSIAHEAAEIMPLHWLRDEEIDGLQSRWNSVQIKFVDDPHASVEQADALVAEALERIEQEHANLRTILDGQGDNHDDISTEGLRIALQSYRSFLNHLLTS